MSVLPAARADYVPHVTIGLDVTDAEVYAWWQLDQRTTRAELVRSGLLRWIPDELKDRARAQFYELGVLIHLRNRAEEYEDVDPVALDEEVRAVLDRLNAVKARAYLRDSQRRRLKGPRVPAGY